MLANTITLNDGTSDHLYDLVSRKGMESIRRETGVSSTLGSSLVIKNTVDLNSPTAKNRHLVQLVKSELNATTGIFMPYSVHAVVTRDKGVSDANITLMVAQLAAFLGVSANLADVLLGGN